MTGRRLFGVETEYAVTALDATGDVIPVSRVSKAIFLAASRRLTSLRGACDTGLFVANGSRVYCDTGGHPEIAGPECLNPWDAVRYLRAGDRILLRLAGEVERRYRSIGRVFVFTGNVDYGGTLATWGTHENYCHRADPYVLRRRLLSHLVSRVIYSGAGGFNPFSHGLEFTLSPRAHHLECAFSEQSTHDRGIIHTREESLSGRGYRRQHLVCGERQRSDVASWLTIGTTALVVALIDGGVACGDDVELAAPVAALRTFVGDVECRATVPSRSSPRTTAIEIQWRYLHHARAHLDAPFMPPWAKVVCDLWEATLERLTAGPDRVSRSIDWAIKLAIYRDRAERRGFSWQHVRVWSAIVAALERARRAGPRPTSPLSVAALNESASLRHLVTELARGEGCSVRWGDLDAFLALRRELLEADMRWGQLGPGSVFEALDGAGVLDHQVQGVDRIDDAVELPPDQGRAHVRGMVIRRLSQDRTRHAAGWDAVYDLHEQKRLDLSDPFTEVERWRAERPKIERPEDLLDRARLRPSGPSRSPWESIRRMLARIGRLSAGSRSPGIRDTVIRDLLQRVEEAGDVQQPQHRRTSRGAR